MRAYYDLRASEYDDWWLGRGRFATRGRPAWSEEVEQLIDLVRALAPARTLDVACGTGFLTQFLPGEVVALDQSRRMVELTAARVPNARVVQGEAVPLPFDDAEFDRLFTGHFYGHLVRDEQQVFLDEARRVARELVVVDTARRADTRPEEWQERVLNDGSTHRVYKRFFTADELAEEVGASRVLHEGSWFVVVAG
jgi:demethylmenaquinone methyltransferase/2-methoxy-6-polyprenyl-1,4-benzoquinol methylase